MLSKRFIDEYPGKLSAYVRYPEKIQEYYDVLISNTSYEYSDEYKEFLLYYVKNGTSLKDIPNLTNISAKSCSSWASDLVPTIRSLEDQFNRCNEKHVEEHDVKPDPSVIALYKRAEEFNADYYEISTGRIFHIQEYNRAKRFGLPVIGIRYSEDGIIKGYVPEP